MMAIGQQKLGNQLNPERVIEEDLSEVNSWLDLTLKRDTQRTFAWAIPALIVICVLAVLIGRASESLILGLLIFGGGLLLVAKLLQKPPNPNELKNEGRRYYLHCSQQELQQWEREIEEKKQAFLQPARESLRHWKVLHPHPDPQPYGVSPEGAENWLRDWMVHMGAEGSEVTQFVSDGGIDIENQHYIAQVKHYKGSVGVGEIREHIGVAAVDPLRRKPVFFTSGSYSAGGVEAANRAEMSLFTYDVAQGVVTANNAYADLLLCAGLNPEWLGTQAASPQPD